MNTLYCTFIAAAVVLSSPICSAETADGPAAGAAAASAPMLRRTIQHDGVEREYFVHLPDQNTGPRARLPVVVGIHGYTSTATGFQLAHDLNRHADKHGYIIVYPQGSHFRAADAQGKPVLITTWNDLTANQPQPTAGPHCTDASAHYPCPPECGECGRCAWQSCYDDVGFITKVLDQVQVEFRVDERRVYLLGVSSGATMALRLGCSLSDRFAAIAPIIGQPLPGHACSPFVDTPMLHLFGAKDEVIRYDGKAGQADGFIYTSAADTAAAWAAGLACQAGPNRWQSAISERAGLECTAYSHCRVEGQEVVSCMDPDGGHVWPEQTSGLPDATCVTSEQYESLPDQHRCPAPTGEARHLGMDLIWAFFSRYRRSIAITPKTAAAGPATN